MLPDESWRVIFGPAISPFGAVQVLMTAQATVPQCMPSVASIGTGTSASAAHPFNDCDLFVDFSDCGQDSFLIVVAPSFCSSVHSRRPNCTPSQAAQAAD
jgi:hypothetical protein